jgi:hypothetical protein
MPCSRVVPKRGGQVTPGTAGTLDPEDRFDESPIILGRTTRIAGLARQKQFNAFPLVIAQHLSIHSDFAQKSG